MEQCENLIMSDYNLIEIKKEFCILFLTLVYRRRKMDIEEVYLPDKQITKTIFKNFRRNINCSDKPIMIKQIEVINSNICIKIKKEILGSQFLKNKRQKHKDKDTPLIEVSQDYTSYSISKHILRKKKDSNNNKINNYNNKGNTLKKGMNSKILANNKTIVKTNTPKKQGALNLKMKKEKDNDVKELQNVLHSLNLINNKKQTKDKHKNNHVDLNDEIVSNILNIENDGPMLIYNFKIKQGRQTSMELYKNDFLKLDPATYLNDTIIMFFLKYVLYYI